MNQIIKDAREFYRQTTAHMVGDPRSHIWRAGSENHRNLERIINTCSEPAEVEDELAKTDMYAIRIPDEKTRGLMMRWHQQIFKNYERERNPGYQSILETPNLVKMGIYCSEIMGIREALGYRIPEIKTIIELGGGNGQFAHVARQMLANKTHVDIDIPESLYMAYVCTRARYPEFNVGWYTPESPIGDWRDYDFVFIPAFWAETILEGEAFDLFINTASMGELPNEMIRQWMNFVQNKISVKYFFGFNRFLNTVYAGTEGFSRERLNENEASVRFDNRWEVLKWEVEPEFARCPYEDPKIARYLEIILARSGEQILPADYLEDTKMEDWWRYRAQDPIGTHRSNQLVHDLTMTGTLFKLWNAIRCGQGTEAQLMMLTYLEEQIGRRKGLVFFEEEFFYGLKFS